MARDSQVPRFFAYWLPYANDDDFMALLEVPDSVEVVSIFAGGLHDVVGEEAIDLYLILSTGADWIQVLKSARKLQSRGKKVVLSLFLPTSWSSPRKWKKVAASVYSLVVETWGLDGIDLDVEGRSPAYLSQDVHLIQHLSRYFGPRSGTPLLFSMVLFASDGFERLYRTSHDWDFVSTMDYWKVSSGSNQETLDSIVAAGLPTEKILFGVSAEKRYRSVSTPEHVQACVLWEPKQGYKGGMMLFDVGGDATQGFPLTKIIQEKYPFCVF